MLFFLVLLFPLPALALGEIRVVAPSDTTGTNYQDVSIAINDTALLELWVEADSTMNGFSAYIQYDGQGLRLMEGSDAGDSFPPASQGLQADEDHTTFGDILRNSGTWSGAATDTFEYAALTTADSVQGSYRAAILSFIGVSTGTYYIIYLFDTASNKITAVTQSNGNATDLFSSGDTGIILITVGDTPVITSLSFVSDTPIRFDQDTPFNTSPAGDTVWFAAETQVVTLTVTFVSTNPDSIKVDPVFDSGTQIDSTASYQAQFFIRPQHATGETYTVVTAYDSSGGIDTTIIYFAPDTIPPDTVSLSTPIDGSIETQPVFRWTQSSDSGTGVKYYSIQLADSSDFANIIVSDSTVLPDTDITITIPVDGIYYWRILAYDSVTNTAQSGIQYESFIYSTDTTSPETFGLLSPLNGTETNITTFRFVWDSALDSSTVTYRLIIDTDMAGSYLVDTTVSDTEEIISLSANDTYYWRVIATDTSYNSTQIGDSYLYIDTIPPAAFTLNLPNDGTETNSTSIVFTWNASSDTGSGLSYYRLQADTAGTFLQLNADSITAVTTETLVLPANDTYYWRVIAVDDAGSTTTVTARTLIIDTAPPSSPVLTAYSGTIVNPAVTLRWSTSNDSISGLAYYNLQIDTAGTFASLLESATVIAGDTDYISGLFVEDTYYWRILAYDSAGNFSISNPAADSFRLVIADTIAPDTFNYTSPADGFDTNSTQILLQWQDSSDDTSPPVRYTVQVDTAGTFTSLYVDSTGLLDTFYLVTLRANETSYWRVIAYDNSGNTTTISSSPRNIFVDTISPAVGSLTAPQNNLDTTSTTIQFAWNAATDTGAGLAYYRLQIDTTGTFAVPFVDSQTINVSEWNTLLPNDTYYWQIIAVDSVGNSSTSTQQQFRIDTAPPTVTVLSAFNGSSCTTPLTLKWTASTDSVTSVTIYVLQIDTAGTFASFIDSATLTHPDTDYITGVLNSDTYYWRVIAYDTLWNTSVSLTDSFRVTITDSEGPNSFDLLLPLDADLTSQTQITFEWEEATDDTSPPVTYRLEVDTAGTFVANIVDTSWFTETTYTTTIAPNETYFWRVTARDNPGNTTISTSMFTFTIDTAPPTQALLHSYSGATVVSPRLLEWTESLDTIAGFDTYLIQVATSSAFAVIVDSDILLAGDTDHWTPILTAGTYYWRVYAYDLLGNSSLSNPSYDSFVVIGDSTPPSVDSSSIQPTSISNSGTTAITLIVYVTDSSYVDSVYIDLIAVGGTESFYLTPSTLPPSTDSVWTGVAIVDSTASGGTYQLPIYVIDPSGNVETATIQIIIVDTSPSLAEILDTPLYQIKAAGDELSIVSTYGDTYLQVLYEYRLAPNGEWLTCTPASVSTNPDTVPPFWGFFWDISDLSQGQQYDVRARATDSTGYTDPNPSYYRIEVNPADSTVHEYRDVAAQKHIRRQMIYPDTTNELLIADGTSILLPPDAVSETVWIRVTLETTLPDTAPLGGSWISLDTSVVRECVREDGNTEFDTYILIVLPYDDNDPDNDYVGQSDIEEADLVLCYYDVTNRCWIPISNSTVDYERNVVSAQVNHFTLFALLVATPAANNLQNVVIYPNPFIPYDNIDKNGKPYTSADPTSGIIFDSLPQQITIEIYDINGRLVSHFAKNTAFGRYNWDARDDSGREVASGVYIAVIKSTTGERVVKKIMIIR